MKMRSNQRSVLFIQATEPGAYPPLINAAHIMAEAGWQVTFLTAPVAGKRLSVTPAPGIQVIDVAERPSHVMSKKAYLDYCRKAIALARKLKPNVVYASDPTGALPGLLAAKLSGARLVYHEHDSPSAEIDLHPVIRWARRWAAKVSEIVIFPNAERGRIAQETIGFDADKLQIVWNVPRLAEVTDVVVKPDEPLLLWYHGSINPERLPETILEAVSEFKGAVRLDVAGYEAPGAKGYVQDLLNRWNTDGLILMRYLGAIEYHEDLLKCASNCHVGLAFMPMATVDINMKHMVGASNKPFDYMAAGLALLVSDLPEWKSIYVNNGFGLVCNPNSVKSIISAITLYMENPEMIISSSKSCQTKIAHDWNYEKEFSKTKL
jgi:glycosyltransferase involved in cell wall biosynthesis